MQAISAELKKQVEEFVIFLESEGWIERATIIRSLVAEIEQLEKDKEDAKCWRYYKDLLSAKKTSITKLLSERRCDSLAENKVLREQNFAMNKTIAEMNEALRVAREALSLATDSIRLLLPMAKGYAHEHPVGSNSLIVSQVEKAVRWIDEVRKP